MKYCPYCGQQLQDDMAFCRKCGKKYPEEEMNQDHDKVSNPVNITKDEVSAQKSNRPKQRNRKIGIVVVVAVCAILALTAAIAMIVISLGNQQRETEELQQMQPAEEQQENTSISDASQSVLYLEVYDDQDELIATASGFLVEDHSTLVTNYHVMEDAYRIVAKTPDGKQSQVISDVINYDEHADLAILRCKGEMKAAPLTLGDSSLAVQGDTIYTAGYPLGLSNTLSDGIISSRYIDENNIDILQITAPISNGSSGGALFNVNGEVIGIISASYTDGQNMNIAVAVNMLSKLLEATPKYTSLSELYMKNHIYGNSALNVSDAPFLAESEDYYYYVDQTDLFAYNKETQNSQKLDKGRYPNVYKGKLYYVSFEENDLCCADLDGTNKKMLGITDTSNHTGMSWSHDRSILNVLIAEEKLFLSIIDHTNEDWPVSLCIYDINSLELLFSLNNTSSSFVYYGNTLYIGEESSSIYAIDMKTLNYELYSTSCIPDIGGVDNLGNVYYTDMYNEFAEGIYKMEVSSGREIVISAVNGPDAGDGKGYDFFVLGNDLHFCEFTLSEYRNSVAISNDVSIEWGTQSVPIAWINAYNNGEYIYTNNGTTIDAKNGQTVGTWVFN